MPQGQLFTGFESTDLSPGNRLDLSGQNLVRAAACCIKHAGIPDGETCANINVRSGLLPEGAIGIILGNSGFDPDEHNLIVSVVDQPGHEPTPGSWLLPSTEAIQYRPPVTQENSLPVADSRPLAA